MHALSYLSKHHTLQDLAPFQKIERLPGFTGPVPLPLTIRVSYEIEITSSSNVLNLYYHPTKFLSTKKLNYFFLSPLFPEKQRYKSQHKQSSNNKIKHIIPEQANHNSRCRRTKNASQTKAHPNQNIPSR